MAADGTLAGQSWVNCGAVGINLQKGRGETGGGVLQDVGNFGNWLRELSHLCPKTQKEVTANAVTS